MNIKNIKINLGKPHTAIFNGHGIDEKIQFIPVGLYLTEEGEFSIVVKNGEVYSLKNERKAKFSIQDYVISGVFSNKNIKYIAESIDMQ